MHNIVRSTPKHRLTRRFHALRGQLFPRPLLPKDCLVPRGRVVTMTIMPQVKCGDSLPQESSHVLAFKILSESFMDRQRLCSTRRSFTKTCGIRTRTTSSVPRHLQSPDFLAFSVAARKLIDIKDSNVPAGHLYYFWPMMLQRRSHGTGNLARGRVDSMLPCWPLLITLVSLRKRLKRNGDAVEIM